MADQAPAAAAAGRTDDEKMKGAIAYVLGFITGIVVLLIAGDNKFLKFHAWQSIIASIVIGIIYFIISVIISTITMGIGALCTPFLALIVWIYFLYGAYMVYSGKEFKVPMLADFVQKTFIK
jgi:uncharacterized membrane protein